MERVNAFTHVIQLIRSNEIAFSGFVLLTILALFILAGRLLRPQYKR